MNRRQVAALAALSAAVFMVAIDGTVLSVAIPDIDSDLHPTYTQILWIGDIYSFALAGLLVTMGNVGDRIGRKRTMLASTLGFGVMSVAAAFAPTAELLIVARALQGVTGAALMPMTLALIRTVFTDERLRTRAIGIWGAAGSAGAAVGPTVAGLLLERFSWGSVLLINVPVVIFILLVGAWALPESRGDSTQPIDLLSIVLSTVGIVAVVFAIKELAHTGPGTPVIYPSAIVGVVALWWFYRRQRNLPVPLLDFGLFRNGAFSGAVLAQFMVVLAATGALFFLSLYFRQGAGFSPLQTGLSLVPVSLVAMITSPNTGRLLRRWGARRVLVLGMAADAVGLLLIGLTVGGPYWTLLVPLALLGFGFGSVLTTASDVVLKAAPPERAGAAVGVSETSFELGGAMGIALLGSALTVLYQAALRIPVGIPPDVAASSRETLSASGPGLAHWPTDLLTLLHEAIEDAFTTSLSITAIAAALALAAATVVTARIVPADQPAGVVGGR